MNTLRNRALPGVGVAPVLAAGSASATNGCDARGASTRRMGQAGLTLMPEGIDASLSIFSPRRNYRTSESLADGACIPDMGCATRKQAGGNELNVSFMYATEGTITGPNNLGPSQNVEFSMHQFELEVSYSWKR